MQKINATDISECPVFTATGRLEIQQSQPRKSEINEA